MQGLSANITLCCNPKYPLHTYKGFIWKYYDEFHCNVHFVNVADATEDESEDDE